MPLLPYVYRVSNASDDTVQQCQETTHTLHPSHTRTLHTHTPPLPHTHTHPTPPHSTPPPHTLHPTHPTHTDMYSGFSYDGRPYPPHPPFEARVYPPSDYTPYGSWSFHNDMYHRQQYLMANRRPIEMQQQRDRARTVSTERLDQLGGYPGNRGSYYGNGYRQGIEEDFLSQPNPSFVPPMPG